MLRNKCDLDSLTVFLRRNPVFMSDVMHLVNMDNDPDGGSKIQDYFDNLDPGAVFEPRFPLHEGYKKYQSIIEKTIQDDKEYAPEALASNQGYLDQGRLIGDYGKSAPAYDDVLQTYWPYGRKETVECLDLGARDKLLEVGIGTGMNLQFYPAGCEITGIDLCENMLKQAEVKLRPGSREVELKLMDSADMGFADNTFDKVLSFWALCSMQSPLSTLHEMARVAKPGARIVILEVMLSPLEEVAILQRLFRPVNRLLDHVYIEGFPVSAVPFDCGLDMLAMLGETTIKPVHTEYFTSTKWVGLVIGENAK